jgi:hypothetical protein
MKVTAYLTEADLRQAVADYMMRKGFNVASTEFLVTREDRRLEVDSIEASVTCETKPKTTRDQGSVDTHLPRGL